MTPIGNGFESRGRSIHHHYVSLGHGKVTLCVIINIWGGGHKILNVALTPIKNKQIKQEYSIKEFVPVRKSDQQKYFEYSLPMLKDGCFCLQANASKSKFLILLSMTLL